MRPGTLSSEIRVPPTLLPNSKFSPANSPYSEGCSLGSLVEYAIYSGDSLIQRQFVEVISTPGVSKASIDARMPPYTVEGSRGVPDGKLTIVPRGPSRPPRFGPAHGSSGKASSHASILTLICDSHEVFVPSSGSSPAF